MSDSPAGTKRLLTAKGLARLMYLRTVYLARQGRAGRAAESLVSSLHMQRLFEREPGLLTHLVKVACVSLCVHALPTVLETGQLSDQELARVESALAEGDPANGLGQVWAGELVLALERSRDPMKGLLAEGGPDTLPTTGPTPIRGSGNWLEDPSYRCMVAETLRVYARFAEVARKAWPEAINAVQEIPAKGHGPFGEPREILVPTFKRSFGLTGHTIGMVRSAQVAVMVERYRLAKGCLPGSLQELREFIGHDLPPDPFTGRELIYKVQPDGFLVYSVGDDKTDDGGPEKARREDFGVVVRRSP
jgi:hypothetical protein